MTFPWGPSSNVRASLGRFEGPCLSTFMEVSPVWILVIHGESIWVLIFCRAICQVGSFVRS